MTVLLAVLWLLARLMDHHTEPFVGEDDHGQTIRMRVPPRPAPIGIRIGRALSRRHRAPVKVEEDFRTLWEAEMARQREQRRRPTWLLKQLARLGPRRFITLALIPALLAPPLFVHAAGPYYLSPTGNNAAAGGISTPWKTIQYAWEHVANGDTIILLTGTWTGTDAMLHTQGSDEVGTNFAPSGVTIQCETGANCIFSVTAGTGTDRVARGHNGNLWTIINGNGLTITKGNGTKLEFKDTGAIPTFDGQPQAFNNAAQGGSATDPSAVHLMVRGGMAGALTNNNCDVLGVTVSRWTGNGVHFNGTQGNEAHDLDVSHCAVGFRFQGVSGGGLFTSHIHHQDLAAKDTVVGGDDFGGEGVSLSFSSHDFTVADCEIDNNWIQHSFDYGTDGAGFEFFAVWQHSNIIITRNSIHDNDGVCETGVGAGDADSSTKADGGWEWSYNYIWGKADRKNEVGLSATAPLMILRACPFATIHHNVFDVQTYAANNGGLRFDQSGNFPGRINDITIRDNIFRIRGVTSTGAAGGTITTPLYNFGGNIAKPAGLAIHHNIVYYTVNFAGNVYNPSSTKYGLDTGGTTNSGVGRATATAATGLFVGDMWGDVNQSGPNYDPNFIAPDDVPPDYHLNPGSPAVGTASDGGDMGVFAYVSPGHLASDTWTTARATGWGNAEIGGLWSAGGGAVPTVVSNAGVLTFTAGGQDGRLTLPVNARDVEILMSFTSNKLSAGGNQQFYAMARTQGPSNDGYMAIVTINTSQVFLGNFAKRIGGTQTAVTTAAFFPTSPPPTFVAGVKYWLRFRVTGADPTTLAMTVWRDGDTEPGAVQFTTTDALGTQITGNVGLRGSVGSAQSNLPVAFSFDDFTADTFDAPILGDVFTTISHPTVAATGAQAFSGAAAPAIGHPTIAATGTQTLPGGGGVTISHPTIAAVGAETFSGAAASSIGHPSIAAVGAVGFSGALATTISHPTVAATGTEKFTSAMAVAISHPVVAATGTVTAMAISGTAAITIGAPSVEIVAHTPILGLLTRLIWRDVVIGDATEYVMPAYKLPANTDVAVFITAYDQDGLAATMELEPILFLTASGELELLASGALSVSTPDPADTFGRTVTDGWGTANAGGAYSLVGTAADFDTTGSEGTINLAALGGSRIAWLPDVDVQDITVTLKIKTSKLAVGGVQKISLLLRMQDPSNYYRFTFEVQTDASVLLKAGKVVGGADTVLATASQPGTVITHTAGGYFWLVAKVLGVSPTTLRFRAWDATDSDPGTWAIDMPDSAAALQSAGAIGVKAALGGSVTNAPVVVTVDALSTTLP